jgi:DNA-binding transcriptional LysR family regulator
MDTRDIEAFLAVAHSRSLTVAASERCQTASAISKALRRVEQEFGVELFDRSGARLQLNEAGVAFAKHAKQIICLVDKAKLSVRGSRLRGEGRAKMAGPAH